MAGDWIKLERATLNKPEVLAIGRITGAGHAAAFLACCKLWCWVDENSVDGFVDGVAPQNVDDIVSLTGFADALSKVGWGHFDTSGTKMTIPNFERHLSQGSKTRSLKHRRQDKWRTKSVDASVDAPAPQARLPEKRREEKILEEKENKQKKSRPPKFDPLKADLPFNTNEFREAWADWCGHRSDIKQPLTERMVQTQLRWMAEVGENRALVAIRHTVFKGWRGLREPDPKDQPVKTVQFNRTPKPASGTACDVCQKADVPLGPNGRCWQCVREWEQKRRQAAKNNGHAPTRNQHPGNIATTIKSQVATG